MDRQSRSAPDDYNPSDEVDLTHTLLPSAVEMMIEPDDDEGLVIIDVEEEGAVEPALPDHFDNLAEAMSEAALDALSMELQNGIEADFESAEPWRKAFERGMEFLGIEQSGARDGPFDAATVLAHPMMAEGAVRFWARSLPEFLPRKGPCKAKIIGERTSELHATAMHVERYMNYQMMVLDKGYHAETAKLLFQLPLRGSAFRKARYDTVTETVVGEFVPADELICNYSTASLQTSERFTHRYPIGPTALRRKQLAGVYRDLPITPDTDLDEDRAETQTSRDNADFKVHEAESATDITLDECYVMLDLEGFEHRDEMGEATGLALPYIVTMVKETGRVLSIYRDYEPDDPHCERIERFTKYDYIPGFGFYGLGFMHLIGSLAETGTNIVRILVNGAASASLGGGFKTKNSNLKQASVVMEPGVWKDIDSTFEELQKSFYSPPVQRPDPMLLEMLKHVEGVAQRMTSTTEVAMGDANNQAPVGTTIALIEQAMVVDNAIQLNLNAGMSHEMAVRMRMIGDFMGEDVVTFHHDLNQGVVTREMFTGGSVEIVPSADPAQSSTMKRIATSQMVMELANQAPHLYDMQAVHRRMLEAAEVSDIEEIMADSGEAVPMDPVQENAAMMLGKPVKVFPDQHDEAHIAVHMAFMENPALGAHPAVAEAVGATMTAHIAEHLASFYQKQAVGIGIPTTPVNADAGKGEPMVPVDPVAQAQASIVGMQLASQMAQFRGLQPVQQGDGGQAEHEQKLRHKDEEHGQKLAQDQEKHAEAMRQRIEEAALTSEERTAKMLDDAADREVQRDQQRIDDVLNTVGELARPTAK